MTTSSMIGRFALAAVMLVPALSGCFGAPPPRPPPPIKGDPTLEKFGDYYRRLQEAWADMLTEYHPREQACDKSMAGVSGTLVAMPIAIWGPIVALKGTQQPITITNTGILPVQVDQVLLYQCEKTGWTNVDVAKFPRFQLTNNGCSPATLAPGESCSVTVTLGNMVGFAKLELVGPGGTLVRVLITVTP